ncbi:hypothetical protein K469DRAFT_587152 [Zopfia rhizophila CBS 207.26]|uniref:Luciferase domain-containing protein n=1 Tax=Zopfia rhizophila CBS 207.26 TaxID=1314779 RepID=A0A6A6DVP5_9PEZI|nr:hypothetical protein K469DRAFT_587152 [Zopfia rhizophila CBS 207.26]
MELLHQSSLPSFIISPISYLYTDSALLTTSPTYHLLIRFLTLLIPVIAFLYLYRDYQSFLSLGPGGTPSTPLGYAKIKILSIVSLRNPCRPLPVPPHFRPQNGYLSSLPRREGERPVVRGIAPQRQQTQKSPAGVYEILVEKLRELARDPENKLVERTSCFEKHSSGLFTSVPLTRTCRGEICHAHPSDGSLHMTLHPADAKVVIENEWGERHPLAKGGWFRRFVPREFVLVYAPRSDEEVETVVRIVDAGVWWVSGVDVRKERIENLEKEQRRMKDVGGENVTREVSQKECWACRVHGCGRGGVGRMVGDA